MKSATFKHTERAPEMNKNYFVSYIRLRIKVLPHFNRTMSAIKATEEQYK